MLRNNSLSARGMLNTLSSNYTTKTNQISSSANNNNNNTNNNHNSGNITDNTNDRNTNAGNSHLYSSNNNNTSNMPIKTSGHVSKAIEQLRHSLSQSQGSGRKTSSKRTHDEAAATDNIQQCNPTGTMLVSAKKTSEVVEIIAPPPPKKKKVTYALPHQNM